VIDHDKPDPAFDSVTARLIRREALRRSAMELSTTTPLGLESALARISADVTADAAAARNDPTRKDPAQKDPAQKDPAQKDPAQKDPAQKDPAQKDSARKDPANTGPARKDPANTGPARKA
jgi:hypothetical protein